MQVWVLGWEEPLEEGMATCFRILPWRMPWTEELGGLQSMELQRVGHDWSDLAAATHVKEYTIEEQENSNHRNRNKISLSNQTRNYTSILKILSPQGKNIIVYNSELKEASQVVLAVKNSPANAGDIRDRGSILGQEDPLEKVMATHSSILAWRIPRTKEPGGL